jgi:hypothetical protein
MGAGRVVMALGLPLALVLLVASVILLFAPNGSVAVSAGGAAAQGPNNRPRPTRG